jgi:hypothetical protein
MTATPFIKNGFLGRKATVGDLPFRRGWLTFTDKERAYTAAEVLEAAKAYVKEHDPDGFEECRLEVEAIEAKAKKDLAAPALLKDEEKAKERRDKAEEDKEARWGKLLDSRIEEMNDLILNEKYVSVKPLPEKEKG